MFSKSILILLVFSFFFYVKALPQNRQVVDSLKQEIATAQEDTSKVKLLFNLATLYRNIYPDTTLYYFQQALDISKRIKSKPFIAKSHVRIGATQQRIGLAENTLESFQQALEIAEEINDKETMSSCYVNIGIVYEDQGSLDKAIEYYQKSLEAALDINFSRGLTWSYNNLGNAHLHQGSYKKAIDYYLKALKIYERQGSKSGMATCYNNIGLVHYNQGSYDKTIEYMRKSLDLRRELGDRYGTAIVLNNIGNVHYEQGLYNEALEYHLESFEIFQEMGNIRLIPSSYMGIGNDYLKLGAYEKAFDYFISGLAGYEELENKEGITASGINVAYLNLILADSVAITQEERMSYLNETIRYGLSSIELAREIGSIPLENDAAKNLSEAYKKVGNYRTAYEFSDVIISTQDSMFNEEKTRAIQEMSTKYETEKKQQQIELQESQLVAKDAKIKQQKILRNALIGGIAAIALIIVIVILAYLQKKRDNKKIVEQNEKILENNEELKKLNEAVTLQKNEIISSINYAQRIQSAILPPETYITELLNENFIFYKPKDIVSGDFYWIKQVKHYVLLVAADCTGHGVPGAFMSMLGISYLNEIVQRREITQANQVLNELRKQIKQSLRQSGQRHESRDGIDIALCVIDTKNNIMQYAGAYNPLYLICTTNGKPELKEIKADSMPVGVHFSKDKSFTNHEIKLEMGDTFYIFSDGFVDQIGGEDNNRFRSKLLKKLLLDIHDQPMYEQKEALERTLKDWMGDHPQRDDILVIGARV